MNETCKRGHVLAETAYVRPNGSRQCRECIKIGKAERKAKVQDQATEPDARAVCAED